MYRKKISFEYMWRHSIKGSVKWSFNKQECKNKKKKMFICGCGQLCRCRSTFHLNAKRYKMPMINFINGIVCLRLTRKMNSIWLQRNCTPTVKMDIKTKMKNITIFPFFIWPLFSGSHFAFVFNEIDFWVMGPNRNDYTVFLLYLYICRNVGNETIKK